jgi:hypothetical protein
MRMLMYVKMPHRTFNAAVKAGTASTKMNRILEANKPEAAYFTAHSGHRGAILVVDLADPSGIPALAEPWFLEFEADVEFHVAMTGADLKKAGLEEIARKWG